MTTDQLRDRIAALFRHPPGAERLGDAAPGEIADAVLAALPAPALAVARQVLGTVTAPPETEAPYPPEVQWIAEERNGNVWTSLASGHDRAYVHRHATHGDDTRLIRVTTTYTVDSGTQKPRPAIAYNDGNGNARVYCITCPRPDDVVYPLDIDAVDDWDLCPSCGRHCIDVARAATPVPGEPPLSPFLEHPACGFRWHGRDGMDIPMRDGQPVCPRCELRRLADEAPQPTTTALHAACPGAEPGPFHPNLCPCPCPGCETDCATHQEEPAPAVTEEAGLCGKTIAVDGTTYPPCARHAGHSTAYCRDSAHNSYFLAAPAVTEEAK